MNTLRFYPNKLYRTNNLLFELKQPMDEILLHLIDDAGCDIDGFNLFTIFNNGIHFKTHINAGFGLRLTGLNQLRVIGVDIYDF